MLSFNEKPTVFSKGWFLKHQNILLFFLNTPILSIWFRWLLCINGKKSDVGENKITQFAPSFLTWKTEDGQIQSGFRTHNKFAKRLYYGLYPVWWLMHQWDMIIANNINFDLNLGFDTLTVYPDPSTGATTVDGELSRYNATDTWGNLRTGAGTSFNATIVRPSLYTDTSATTDRFNQIRRCPILFDTSALTAAANISATDLNMTASPFISDALSMSVNLTEVSLGTDNALANSDYNIANWTSTKLTTDKAISTISASSTWTFTLNSDGRAAVSKTGNTSIGMRFSEDIDNSAPTWSSSTNEQLGWESADATGTSLDPELVVTYTLGVPIRNLALLGVGL